MRKLNVGLVTVLLATSAALFACEPAAAPNPPATPRPGGGVQVSLAGPVRSAEPTLLGLNGVNLKGPRWDERSFDKALRRFAPGVIRYAGGTVANYWSWPDGWFQPGRWPGEPAQAIDDRLGVFAVGLRAAAAAPLFDLNTVTYRGVVGSAAHNAAMLGQQLSFLRSAAASGVGVTMVELGNEVYLKGFRSDPPGPNNRDYARRFPTAASYATQMNPWIAAIHRAFPGVKIATVATDTTDVTYIAERRLTWNAVVLPLLRGEDAVTVHENLRVSDASDTAAALLAVPYLHFKKLQAHELAVFRSRGLPVWITEFNLVDLTPKHVFQGTWLHGLFVAEEALLFLSDPTITYVGLNATVGSAQAAAIFADRHGFGDKGPPTVPSALTAGGTALSVIQSAFHRASSARPLAFTGAAKLAGTGTPALVGEALRTPAGPELVLVNLSPRPVTLNLAAIFPHGFKATQLSARSARTLVTGPKSTTRRSAYGTTKLRVEPHALVDVFARGQR